MKAKSEDHSARSRIQGLEALLKAAGAKHDAPVDKWDPPYCGDIGLQIASDGTWSYQGSDIGRPALVKLFATVLKREEDGRYFLVTPVEKIDVAVADAPFLAVEMEVRDEGRDQLLIFRTNLDDVVTCDGEHPLRFAEEKGGDGLKPYVRVRGGLDALVARSVTYDLLELAEEDGAGGVGIWSGREFFPIPGYADEVS